MSGLSPGTTIIIILLLVLVNHVLKPITSVIGQWGVTFVSASKLVKQLSSKCVYQF